MDEVVDEGREDKKEFEEEPGAEKRLVDFDIGLPRPSLVSVVPETARYCALSVVTRIACLSRALSGTPLGRKLSRASKARNPSCCTGERENGEGWGTDALWIFFRWIPPDEACRDVVEEKGEPFEERRECEESRNF